MSSVAMPCRHAKKQHVINEFGTDGVAPALQRSESQDSWCSVTSSLYSGTSNLEGDGFEATTVSAGQSAGVDRLSDSQSDWLNSIMDSDNRYQEYGTPSMQVYSTSPANRLAPQDLHRNLDQMSRVDIFSQNSSHLPTKGNKLPSISQPRAPYFPEQNESWPRITQSDGGNRQRPEYLVSLQSCRLPSDEFQQSPALSNTCMIHQAFMQPPRRPHCHGCCACNAVVSEAMPADPQPEINSSTRISPHFDSPSFNSIRDQTVPDHLFYNNLPPKGVVSGSSLDMRIQTLIPGKTRYLSWDSHLLPSQIQDRFERSSMNQMDVDLSRLSYQGKAAFGTNTGPQYGHNTFEGYVLPSSSSNGTVMMTNRSRESIFDQTTQFPNRTVPYTFEFSQTSTDILYAPQPTIADQEVPLLGEPLSLNAQPNCTFTNFPQPSPPMPTSESNNILISRGQKLVSHNLHLLAIPTNLFVGWALLRDEKLYSR
jgi:hypothetical protein